MSDGGCKKKEVCYYGEGAGGGVESCGDGEEFRQRAREREKTQDLVGDR
jgi:hypothetical protein